MKTKTQEKVTLISEKNQLVIYFKNIYVFLQLGKPTSAQELP